MLTNFEECKRSGTHLELIMRINRPFFQRWPIFDRIWLAGDWARAPVFRLRIVFVPLGIRVVVRSRFI